jgi:hypothetical protein
MRQEIEELASEIFDKEELPVIQELILAYCGSDEQHVAALGRLRYIIPSRPKRPMYYVNHRIGFLPEDSRFVVEQSGSYIDLLIKELRYELTGVYRKRPLGENVSFLLSLKDKIDPDLVILLKRILSFNNVAYAPAKHVYGPPTDDRHYFDVDDSMVIALVAVKLGEEVKKRSEYARNMCQDLVLPGQQKILGNHPRTDFDGVPIDFKKRLLESKSLNLNVWGCVIY